MTADIALFLTQDGVVNAAVYALIALAIVLVFTVTRILFVPQGEFISYSALSLASLNAGTVPRTVWAMLAGTILAIGLSMFRERRRTGRVRFTRWYALALFYATAVAALTFWLAPQHPSQWIAILLTIAIVAPLGPILYTLFFEGIASSSVLTLLIAAVALQVVLVGLGLLLFGAEGWKSDVWFDASLSFGSLLVSTQSILVVAVVAAVMSALAVFFRRSLYGKALRATAVSRSGAKLVGIKPSVAGRVSFLLAGLIGAVSGVLIASLTTMYYDSGFLIGLKGFVAAILGGLVSYPIAVLGALAVGLLEAFSSFWLSAFKEVIVFALIIPILLWRSLNSPQADHE